MKYRKVLPHIFFAVLVGVFVLLNNFSLKGNQNVQYPSANNQIENTKQTARVIRVVDGDTIKVLINNKEDTVRLIGIDAPETVDPRGSVQCFGKEASDKAKEILDGKTITLETDPTQGNRDKYQRLLRYVLLDGINFNELMISEGFAHEFTYKNNPYKYMGDFKNAEKKAREGKIGLWADVIQCSNE